MWPVFGGVQEGESLERAGPTEQTAQLQVCFLASEEALSPCESQKKKMHYGV